MQSQNAQYFAGHKNPDTQLFDDSHQLNQYQGAPHKIQEIALLTNGKSVVGLRAVYRVLGWNQVVEGGNHTGKGHHGAHPETLKLRDDEYITEVSGRGGEIIDFLKVSTNLGNTIEVGGMGGNPFNFTAPYGKHFATLRGGLGGDLHFLDLTTEPLPHLGGFQPFQPQEDQFFRGKRHGDTQNFSDQDLLRSHQGQHKIQTIRVFHDDKCIVGLQADYFVYGPNETVKGPKHVASQSHVREETIQLEADEFITEIYGRHTFIINFIGFKTNKDNRFEYGGKDGDAFEVKAPHGRHFAILRGGLGGHLHNVDFVVEPIFQQVKKFEDNEFRRGKSHSDTTKFNDATILSNYPPSHKIWKLTVFHDRDSVFGLQANYFIFGPNVVVEGERHVGNKWNGGVEDVIELAADEYITEVFGRHGDILDNLGFVTSKGRKFNFGGSGGNPFDVKAPQGQHFGTLSGGYGGHLHNVEFEVLPFHQAAPKWF